MFFGASGEKLGLGMGDEEDFWKIAFTNISEL